MSKQKTELKIGRYVRLIGEDDLVLDNGACIQVITQHGPYRDRSYAPLIMSKKMFKELKSLLFIYKDEEKTVKANAQYEKPFLTYYRFDIERMCKAGYPVKAISTKGDNSEKE